jgi:hypothetical protein
MTHRGGVHKPLHGTYPFFPTKIMTFIRHQDVVQPPPSLYPPKSHAAPALAPSLYPLPHPNCWKNKVTDSSGDRQGRKRRQWCRWNPTRGTVGLCALWLTRSDHSRADSVSHTQNPDGIVLWILEKNPEKNKNPLTTDGVCRVFECQNNETSQLRQKKSLNWFFGIWEL